MTYELEFHRKALKEWKSLSEPIREQLLKKLAERLENPHVPGSRLRGARDRYKIKLRSSGIRLVYQVQDDRLVVQVLAIGKRDRNSVYKSAAKR